MEKITQNLNALITNRNLVDTAKVAASLTPLVKFESPLSGLTIPVDGLKNQQASINALMPTIEVFTKNFANLGALTGIADTLKAHYASSVGASINSLIKSGILNSPTESAVNVAAGWLQASGFTPTPSSLGESLSTVDWLHYNNIQDLLADARAFESVSSNADLEEPAQEFLDQNPEVAVQIYNAPEFIHLSIADRKLVSNFVAVVVFLWFVWGAVYGITERPAFWELISALGLGASDVSKFAHRKTEQLLDKVDSATNDELSR